MTDLTTLVLPEFVLRTLALHWVTATIVTLLVAVSVSAAPRLSATNRHNVWLLTLTSIVLMPMLVLVPRPDGFQTRHSSIIALSPVTEVSVTSPGRVDRAAPGAVNDAFDTSAATTRGTIVSVDRHVVHVAVALFMIWLIGASWLLYRFILECRAARELKRQSDPVTACFDRRLDHLCVRLGLATRPPLRFQSDISAPMTVGFTHLWVAIPASWRDTVDARVLDQTLTHELGHIARRDPLIYTAQRLLGIVLWMYPAVWYIACQMDAERESACDDWVLAHEGQDHSYAANLLNVAESVYVQPAVHAVGCLRTRSQLSRRIHHLLDASSDHRVRASRSLMIMLSAGIVAMLSVSAVAWPDVRALGSVEPVIAPESSVRAPQAPDAPPTLAIAEARPVSPMAPAQASPQTRERIAASPRVAAMPEPESPVAPSAAPTPVIAPQSAQAPEAAPHPDTKEKPEPSVKEIVISGHQSDLIITRWPVRAGKVSLAFGEYGANDNARSKPHSGMDFPARAGTPITAVAAGRVVEAGFTESYGRYVVIDHGNGFKTKYASNQENSVKPGDTVEAHQRIAAVGSSTPNSTGPHLHFEVIRDGVKMDPRLYYSKTQ